MTQPLLVAQSQALSNFLEDLLAEDIEDSNLSVDQFLDNSLDESPEEPIDESSTDPTIETPVESDLMADAAPAVEPQPVLPETEEAVTSDESTQEPIDESSTEPTIETPVEFGLMADAEPAAEPQPVLPETAEAVTAEEPVATAQALPPSLDNERTPVLPDWGLKPFQAMVFKVGELSLAIPVTELEGVIEWKSELLAGPVGSGLCLGDYSHDGRSVSVIDIARLIFAGSQLNDLMQAQASQRVTRIILIDNMKFGLAVDAVFEMITIQPTRVNWRSTRTRRQWLAGTMLDDMIVVLDAQSTAKILSGMLTESE